jgi:4a-hydroxytetrahydrobiopterin dehydratase
MARSLLSEEEISSQFRELKGWTRTGSEIRKTVECTDFVRAMGFVNSLALLAERINHHPDIDIRWNKVTLTLSTHSEGGLTDLDFKLAKSIDQL